jgi:hypothetical protein
MNEKWYGLGVRHGGWWTGSIEESEKEESRMFSADCCAIGGQIICRLIQKYEGFETAAPRRNPGNLDSGGRAFLLSHHRSSIMVKLFSVW